MIESIVGEHLPASLLEPGFIPSIVRLSKSFDDDGMERGQRINGYVQCPRCGLWWPNVEEPDMWDEGCGNQWIASGWWGSACCCECDLLMIEQPDGTPEVYKLR